MQQHQSNEGLTNPEKLQ